ncbi:MAG: hypothetical protein HY482_02905 [Candidatus Wildermuthbacteria bacterium]|nr:hypothetical protein [Candidatus Wildermuthbacteria bacterium]
MARSIFFFNEDESMRRLAVAVFSAFSAEVIALGLNEYLFNGYPSRISGGDIVVVGGGFKEGETIGLTLVQMFLRRRRALHGNLTVIIFSGASASVATPFGDDVVFVPKEGNMWPLIRAVEKALG